MPYGKKQNQEYYYPGYDDDYNEGYDEGAYDDSDEYDGAETHGAVGSTDRPPTGTTTTPTSSGKKDKKKKEESGSEMGFEDWAPWAGLGVGGLAATYLAGKAGGAIGASRKGTGERMSMTNPENKNVQQLQSEKFDAYMKHVKGLGRLPKNFDRDNPQNAARIKDFFSKNVVDKQGNVIPLDEMEQAHVSHLAKGLSPFISNHMNRMNRAYNHVGIDADTQQNIHPQFVTTIPEYSGITMDEKSPGGYRMNEASSAKMGGDLDKHLARTGLVSRGIAPKVKGGPVDPRLTMSGHNVLNFYMREAGLNPYDIGATNKDGSYRTDLNSADRAATNLAKGYIGKHITNLKKQFKAAGKKGTLFKNREAVGALLDAVDNRTGFMGAAVYGKDYEAPGGLKVKPTYGYHGDPTNSSIRGHDSEAWPMQGAGQRGHMQSLVPSTYKKSAAKTDRFLKGVKKIQEDLKTGGKFVRTFQNPKFQYPQRDPNDPFPTGPDKVKYYQERQPVDDAIKQAAATGDGMYADSGKDFLQNALYEQAINSLK